jgi:hypothetical protein
MKQTRKLIGAKKTFQVCICNVEGKLAADYRAKTKNLPITLDFTLCDQHKSRPKAGQYDLVVYTPEGNHTYWEGLKRDYSKDHLIYCNGGITRVIEALKDWLGKQGVIV